MIAAIFDLDGTLADSEELAATAAEDGLRAYYARRGLAPVIPSREERRALVGLPSLEYFARLLPPERGGDAREVRELVARREVERLAAGRGRLFPGAREALAALRSRGWKLGLVSNCGRIYFDANLEHLGLREAFDVALCLDDFPTKIENVRHALARLRANGGPGLGERSESNGLMVGDRQADVEAGRANGLRTVGCLYGFGTPEELASADWHIASLAELPALAEAIA